MGEYSPAKTGEFLRITPDFQNCVHCKKDLKDNKSNSAHLGRKDARIFVLGNYLFLAAHSFPQAMLSENRSLLRTDNIMSADKYPNIFLCQIGYCLYVVYFSFPLPTFLANKFIQILLKVLLSYNCKVQNHTKICIFSECFSFTVMYCNLVATNTVKLKFGQFISFHVNYSPFQRLKFQMFNFWKMFSHTNNTNR